MKKIILLIIPIMLLTAIVNKEKYYVIPDNAIRLRIIANSNSIEDQYLKNKIKNNLEKELEAILKTNSINETRTIIEKNISNINQIIEKTLKEENKNITYKVEFKNNYFPEKKYLNVKYNEGYYESLVITLGEGKGNNWWCVLFPPICNIEDENKDEIEYKLYIKEIFDKYVQKGYTGLF